MENPIKIKLDGVSSVEQVQAALQEKLGESGRPPSRETRCGFGELAGRLSADGLFNWLRPLRFWASQSRLQRPRRPFAATLPSPFAEPNRRPATNLTATSCRGDRCEGRPVH